MIASGKCVVRIYRYVHFQNLTDITSKYSPNMTNNTLKEIVTLNNQYAWLKTTVWVEV